MNEFPTYKVITYRTSTAASKAQQRQTRLGTQATVEITNLQLLLKELSKVNDETRKQFRKDFRKIAEPVRDEIKKGISSNRLGIPGSMRGFQKKVIPGRLTWGTGKPANSAIISMPRITTRKAGMAISKITVGSPATVIADMAGKSNKVTGKKRRTDPYPYSLSPTGQRTHRITSVGSRKFIQNLDSTIGNRASRVVYPSAEKALPEAQKEMGLSLDDMVQKLNRELRKAN